MSSYPTRHRQRLVGFDYRTTGCYFVTLCVQDRLPLFSQIQADKMHPSPAGDMIDQMLEELASHYPGVELDTVMVMPDHLHGILALGDGVPSLSKIMQWFKAQSTARYARAVQEKGWERFAGRLWQRGVYDRVIRTDEELHAIHEYVVTHLQRWALRHEGQ